MTSQELRKAIALSLPEGSVIPRHTDEGHFYEVPSVGKTYPSVTGKLQALKDVSLMNYKMNRAIDYVFAHYREFTPENVMEHLDEASKASGRILEDAGDIGTDIHAYREAYFVDWIKAGKMPERAPIDYIDPTKRDIRAISAMRALAKFVADTNYEPVWSELLVYDEKYGIAGTLDDLGIMDHVVREGRSGCDHGYMHDPKTDAKRCMKCDRKVTRQFVLMDVKTSNQFKDSYFLQVAMYYMMFKKLTKLIPKRCFILKLSKENGTYQIEDLKKMAPLTSAAKSMLALDKAMDVIASMRKDNQRKVLQV